MTEIQRYELTNSSRGYISDYSMEKTSDGDFVKYDDHLAALAMRDGEIAGCTALRDEMRGALAEREREMERLRKQMGMMWNAIIGVDASEATAEEMYWMTLANECGFTPGAAPDRAAFVRLVQQTIQEAI